MQNPVAFDIEYREHMRQMAWINETDWQFERPAKRHPVRQAVTRALLALANALSSSSAQETHAA